MYIKSCPFCGNSIAPKICDENELAICDCKSDNPYYAVVCIVNEDEINTPNWETGCGASGGFAATKKEAVEKWNRRMPSIEDWASALARCAHIIKTDYAFFTQIKSK